MVIILLTSLPALLRLVYFPLRRGLLGAATLLAARRSNTFHHAPQIAADSVHARRAATRAAHLRFAALANEHSLTGGGTADDGNTYVSPWPTFPVVVRIHPDVAPSRDTLFLITLVRRHCSRARPLLLDRAGEVEDRPVEDGPGG